ncbi:MAG: helix-turn-helix domain-containing protein [Treponema sp.]|nr:helix-turn-helix domain-containing protein [Treponema sp.]
MVSLGNKLKTARESRNETYDEVSFRINVASRYLEALEAEDFSVFPAETYVLGFMKTYGEYLGLDPKDLLELYKSTKLQEQPIPTELLKPQWHFPVKLVLTILGVLVLLALIGGGVYLVLQRVGEFEISLPKPSSKAKNWMVDSFPIEKRLFVNDSFIIPYKDTEYRLTLLSVEDTLTVTSNDTDVIAFDLGVETPIDIDTDGFSDIIVTALDFVKNKPSTGARLLLEFDDSPQNVLQMTAEDTPAETSPSVNETQTVIFSSSTPYPFTLQITFQEYCLFRWEILAESNRQGRNEQYFERNRELSIQAQNGVRIGASNAAAVKIQVIGGGRQVPLELGAAGEVIVVDVRWIREEENRYRLALVLLE